MDVGSHDDRQESILHGVGLEDVGERRADDGAEPELHERPHRVFARAPTAEVLPYQQDGGPPPAERGVDGEVGSWPPGRVPFATRLTTLMVGLFSPRSIFEGIARLTPAAVAGCSSVKPASSRRCLTRAPSGTAIWESSCSMSLCGILVDGSS